LWPFFRWNSDHLGIKTQKQALHRDLMQSDEIKQYQHPKPSRSNQQRSGSPLLSESWNMFPDIYFRADFSDDFPE